MPAVRPEFTSVICWFRAIAKLLLTLTMAVLVTACQGQKSPPKLERRKPSPSPIEKPAPQKLTKWQRVAESLRQSPMGQLIERYLHEPLNPDQSVEISHQIVERVFDGKKSSMISISAIHILIQDAYLRGKLNDESYRRLVRLQADLNQKQQDMGSYMGEGIAYLAVITFIAFLPLGYPPVRHALKHVIRYMAQKLGSLIHSPTLKNTYKKIPPLSEGAKTYQPIFVIKQYFAYFGPVSFVYFFWFDWKESTRGHSIETYIESSMTPESFDKFVEDLKQL